MKLAIIGDGGWGTALAAVLAGGPCEVILWGAFPEYIREMATARENRKFLPGIHLPESLALTDSLETALSGADIALFAVPSPYIRAVARRAAALLSRTTIVVSAAKGFEKGTWRRMSEVLHEEISACRICVLSGPNIAYEVACGMPSAAVCAGSSSKAAGLVQEALMRKSFRLYTSGDVVGVEISGAVKNSIAIACGIADGLGFGANTKGALITRGVAEISRLGTALGAERKTFSGLSGMGDLVTTCLSPRSRNRTLGEAIAKGARLSDYLSRTEMVVEGVDATRAIVALAEEKKVDMPIIQEVYAVLFHHKDPERAVGALMERMKKAE